MTAQRAHSDTLTVNAVYPVAFTQTFSTITVMHRGTTGIIWVRTDGINPVVFNPANPSASDDNYPVGPGQTASFANGILTQQPINRVINGTSVALISDTAIPFTVYGS